MDGILVIKIGGAAVDDPAAAVALFRQVARLGEAGTRVVLVHGGGARVTALAARLGVATQFEGGRRVTDAATLDCVKLGLAGGVASDLASAARLAGVAAVPITGLAGGLIEAVRRPAKAGVDLGFVGDVVAVNPAVLTTLLHGGFVPLVGCLAGDAQGQALNINADTIACAVAGALPGSRLIILTDVDGVRRDLADPASRIPQLNATELATLNVSGGMLPKLASVRDALAAGAREVHIACWRTADVLPLSLSGDRSIGTRIFS